MSKKENDVEEAKHDELEIIDETDPKPDKPAEQTADSEMASEEPDSDDADDEVIEIEDEEDAEARRERNAKRRAERKELRRTRIAEDKARLRAQERQIEELTERLLKVENSQAGAVLSRIDSNIEKQEELIYRIRQVLATTEDRNEHADLIDRLSDEKLRLRDLKSQKDSLLKQAKEKPRQNVSSKELEQDRLTKQWLRRNTWYDPNGKGFDSKITLAIDQALQEEGIWDASSHEYWDELDRRLRKQIPHRFDDDGDDGYVRRKLPPQTSSRSERASSPAVGKNQFFLSRERKQAMIDAGIWDDPEARMRQIKAYQRYDKEHGTS